MGTLQTSKWLDTNSHVNDIHHRAPDSNSHLGGGCFLKQPSGLAQLLLGGAVGENTDTLAAANCSQGSKNMLGMKGPFKSASIEIILTIIDNQTVVLPYFRASLRSQAMGSLRWPLCAQSPHRRRFHLKRCPRLTRFDCFRQWLGS